MAANDGGTELKRRRSVSFVLLARIPFTGKVARTISARYALLADKSSGNELTVYNLR